MTIFSICMLAASLSFTTTQFQGNGLVQRSEAKGIYRRDCWFKEGCRPARSQYCRGSNCKKEPKL